MREGGWGGGWTVAFSRPDKSKKEWLVINVPKWPRVTGRPSPMNALKRGHLHNHPSHRHAYRHMVYILPVSICPCICFYVWIKQILPQVFAMHIYTGTWKLTMRTEMHGIFQMQLMVALALVAQVCHFTVQGAGH